MGVKLRLNKKANGVQSYYLDITANNDRVKEYLGLHLVIAKTADQKAHNKEVTRLAEKLCAERALKFLSNEFDETPVKSKKIDFVEYFSEFVKKYTGKDVRLVSCSLQWFESYLKTKKIKTIKPKELTPELCKGFADYLKENLNGETPSNYFSKFKRVVVAAFDEKLINSNPVKKISVSKEKNALKKDILSMTEIQLLANTPCSNNDVKRAFLFSCFSGLRWVDVKELKFGDIDYSNNRLRLVQSKTESSLYSPLNETLIDLIGEPGEPKQLIFHLPSHTGCLKLLRTWTKKAGITKHITWHCARHGFAVILLSDVKADIKTVSSLMGHSTIAMTEKYLRVVDDLKKQAMSGLPKLKI